MPADYDAPICHHLNVTHMETDGSVVLFEFLCKGIGSDGVTPVAKSAKVWFPPEVLESLLAGLPTLLSDMKEFKKRAESGATTGLKL